MKKNSATLILLALLLVLPYFGYSQANLNQNLLNLKDPGFRVTTPTDQIKNIVIMIPDAIDAGKITVKYTLTSAPADEKSLTGVENITVSNNSPKSITILNTWVKANGSNLNYIVFYVPNSTGTPDVEKMLFTPAPPAPVPAPAPPTGARSHNGSANSTDAEGWAVSHYGILNKYTQNDDYSYDPKLNQIRQGNIIHVFIDENGSMIRSSLPTTAAENNFFVFHVIYQVTGDSKNFHLDYTGNYSPLFEVYGGKTKADSTNSNSNAAGTVFYNEQILGPIGPFTNTLSINIYEQKTPTVSLLKKTIPIAKLHHIALNAGLFASNLRDPQNVKPGIKSNGDSTLYGSDPTTRGIITVMLTFYPKPRNLLFPLSKDWKDKIGFTIGTGITKNLAENFFAGISYDVARGLAVVGGVHYGRHNVTTIKDNFDLGNDKFTGPTDNLIIQRWDPQLFIGVNIDSRLLSYIFNSATQ